MLHSAAASDPRIAELGERYSSERFAGQRELSVRILDTGGTLPREGLWVDVAANTLFAIGSPETFRLLTVDRGWSPERFERWYAETLSQLLLGDR